MLGYNELCLVLDTYDVDQDNYTMAPWAYRGDQWMCYDDVESIETKVIYIWYLYTKLIYNVSCEN